MEIYLDQDFKCHLTDDGTRKPAKVDFFRGKCPEFVEGYRYVPAGEIWISPEGRAFCGELIAPWQAPDVLDALQRRYERQLLSEYGQALETLGVKL